jgi:hypothetical protein
MAIVYGLLLVACIHLQERYLSLSRRGAMREAGDDYILDTDGVISLK